MINDDDHNIDRNDNDNDNDISIIITTNDKNDNETIYDKINTMKQYMTSRWIQLSEKLDKNFEVTERKTTVNSEITCGFIHFFSCLYVLPVVPSQMTIAGYNKNSSIVAISFSCCLGCILASYLTNLPFVISPPTAVSIYLSSALSIRGIYDHSEGDTAVMLSGFALLLIGLIKPLIKFIKHLIPDCIQASTAVGIGLITAFAGAIEIKLVVRGTLTILSMGQISAEIIIATISLIVSSVALYYHIKGSFIIGLIFGTIAWWVYTDEWPSQLIGLPEFDYKPTYKNSLNLEICSLLFSLVFLYILTVSGLARSLSDQAGLTLQTGSVPRGNWIYILCGITTIISGYLSGPPILISPESAAGIKAGAKTGLSTLVCGILFGISVFFSPLFARVPPAGTSPLLFLVGMLLFQNVSRINWKEVNESVPAFIVLFFVPFTYSLTSGIVFGYILYITINLFTGNLYNLFNILWNNIVEMGTMSFYLRHQDYQAVQHDNENMKEELEILEKIHSVGEEDKSINNNVNDIIMSRRRSESIIDSLFPMDLHHHENDIHKSTFYH